MQPVIDCSESTTQNVSNQESLLDYAKHNLGIEVFPENVLHVSELNTLKTLREQVVYLPEYTAEAFGQRWRKYHTIKRNKNCTVHVRCCVAHQQCITCSSIDCDFLDANDRCSAKLMYLSNNKRGTLIIPTGIHGPRCPENESVGIGRETFLSEVLNLTNNPTTEPATINSLEEIDYLETNQVYKIHNNLLPNNDNPDKNIWSKLSGTIYRNVSPAIRVQYRRCKHNCQGVIKYIRVDNSCIVYISIENTHTCNSSTTVVSAMFTRF